MKPRILVYRSKSSYSFYYLTFLVGAGFRLVIPRARITACLSLLRTGVQLPSPTP
nr:MAG TPA: hypothetical protein [Caudoviricetes sp.]